MESRKNVVVPDPVGIKRYIIEDEKNIHPKDDSKEQLLSTIDDNLDKSSANNKKTNTDEYNRNASQM